MIRLINIFLFVFFANGISVGQTQVDSKGEVNECIKVYTDRDVYMPGETIWFTADYLVNGFKPDVELSKVLYVELFSLDGNSLVRSKFKIIDNKIDGRLEIPLALESNYYLLRAYTHFQRNSHPQDLYNQLVTIINPTIPLARFKTDDSWIVKHAPLASLNKIEDANDYAFQFNPKLNQKIKFAQIVDTASNLISEVKLYNNGLGRLNIIPDFGSKYYVRLILINADTIVTPISFDLPLLPISTSSKRTSFEVNLNLAKEQEDSVFSLQVYSQSGKLIQSTIIPEKKENPAIIIPSEDLNSGLYFILLKTPEGKLISTKVFYKFQEPSVELKISTDKKSYTKRERVNVVIEHKGKNDELTGPFSLTVVKSETINQNENLPAYLAENPLLLFSYFKAHPKINNSVKNQVETLIAIYNLGLDENKLNFLTKNNTNAKWVPETRGASLSGIVRNRETKYPLPGIEVFVSILGDNPQLKIFTTDSVGEFIFALDHIEDLTNVYLTVNDIHADSIEILVLSDFSGEMLDLSTIHLNIDTNMRNFIEEMYVNSQLTDIYGGFDTLKSIATSAIRFSTPMVSIKLDDYVPMNSIEAVFNELVPFVKVRKKNQTYVLEVLDEKTKLTYDKPIILVDDLPVFDVAEILKIHPSVVEEIEVMNSTYVYGDHVVKGIILITTTTNNFGNIELPSSFTSLEFQAPSSATKNLFSDYNQEENRLSRKPDFRNTLYFDENIILENGQANLSFFASDNINTYDVILRGTTKAGETIFGQTKFSITP